MNTFKNETKTFQIGIKVHDIFQSQHFGTIRCAWFCSLTYQESYDEALGHLELYLLKCRGVRTKFSAKRLYLTSRPLFLMKTAGLQLISINIPVSGKKMTLVSSEAQFSAVLAAKISDLTYFVIFLHECLNEKDSVYDTRFLREKRCCKSGSKSN